MSPPKPENCWDEYVRKIVERREREKNCLHPPVREVQCRKCSKALKDAPTYRVRSGDCSYCVGCFMLYGGSNKEDA